MQGFPKKIQSSLPEAEKDINEIISLIDEAITKTKALARGLYPVKLESHGFMASVSELCNNTERIFGITCKFEYNKPLLIDDNIMATHLYRIIQEAVNNAIRHGNAKDILIGLENIKDLVTLTIKNNGRSFRKSKKDSQGMGISIMRYMAATIGAALDIKRGVSGGTVVTCTFQLRRGSE